MTTIRCGPVPLEDCVDDSMECSVERRVERGVREVHVTPLTVPVCSSGWKQLVCQTSKILKSYIYVDIFL